MRASPKDLPMAHKALFERILLRPGVVPTPHLLGGRIPINTVGASDVLAVHCRHVNDRVDTPTFSIAPRSTTFSAKMIDPTCPEEGIQTRFSMKGTQVPLISNSRRRATNSKEVVWILSSFHLGKLVCRIGPTWSCRAFAPRLDSFYDPHFQTIRLDTQFLQNTLPSSLP